MAAMSFLGWTTCSQAYGVKRKALDQVVVALRKRLAALGIFMVSDVPEGALEKLNIRIECLPHKNATPILLTEASAPSEVLGQRPKQAHITRSRFEDPSGVACVNFVHYVRKGTNLYIFVDEGTVSQEMMPKPMFSASMWLRAAVSVQFQGTSSKELKMNSELLEWVPLGEHTGTARNTSDEDLAAARAYLVHVLRNVEHVLENGSMNADCPTEKFGSLNWLRENPEEAKALVDSLRGADVETHFSSKMKDLFGHFVEDFGRDGPFLRISLATTTDQLLVKPSDDMVMAVGSFAELGEHWQQDNAHVDRAETDDTSALAVSDCHVSASPQSISAIGDVLHDVDCETLFSCVDALTHETSHQFLREQKGASWTAIGSQLSTTSTSTITSSTASTDTAESQDISPSLKRHRVSETVPAMPSAA
ncbi:Hypothetical Protein FCC1311_080222 [Hondaea fermentalgiana]|uniref:Uncharacterized protein n=1 Tax=Hondaea fermentalgiana TaxID=2315210 RepID=A0A2R5GLP6_9STRA|nr:Hypothetical Protein FCC1311_080222 [Hondaea fermentalgiana]|eukprot:GBG31797.1 Hypothetical Protein FCC1311_080222 [Hondaea fermentalgiana]